MANTYNLLASTTIGSGGTPTITFNNILNTYTDLKIVISGRLSQSITQSNPTISFNGSTTNFTFRFLYGTGSGVGNTGASGNAIADTNAANSTASIFTNMEIYIPNYTSSLQKRFIIDSAQENNATLAYPEVWTMLWSDTSVISSIAIDSGSTWVQYSTAYLYGIKNS